MRPSWAQVGVPLRILPRWRSQPDISEVYHCSVLPELAVSPLPRGRRPDPCSGGLFLVLSMCFVYWSFYGMRIQSS
jgi:hypothetical protein